MIRKILYATLASAALTVGAAHATETIVWWDFLSGGDGVRMKAMLDEFNKEHDGKVHIDATTLEWGVPFYTKVQTSAATGQGPDVMTYHESRMPLGISTGSLSPIAPEELAAAGIKASDFGPANWKAAQGTDGQQYAVPLDIHSIILYYNKDMLRKAGLLGDDGKPKGLDGAANFDAALAKLTTKEVAGLSVPNDGATGWRIFYTLLNQQDGQFFKDGKFLDGDNLDKATTALAEMQKWVKSGATPANTEYPASIALFTSGKAAISPRRASSSTGARSRSRLSTPIPRPGRIRIRSRSRTASAIRSIPPSASWCSTPSIGSTSTRSSGRAAAISRPTSRFRRAPSSRRSSRIRTIRRWPRPPSSTRSRLWLASRRPSMTRRATMSSPQ
jgi:ABC-type glycerol-3-phosphate transport system substrate-binding protein